MYLASKRSLHLLTTEKFWELPESAEDVFSLFSPADIRRIRDESLGNLETLILALCSRLCALRNHPSFPDSEVAPERDALNCVRILSRLLPYIYEADHLDSWEERFFWGVRRKRVKKNAEPDVLFDESTARETQEPEGEDFEEAKPLAEELIDTLIDLLFFSDFTLLKLPPDKPKVSYAIWQSGVGCNNAVGTSQEVESRRMEVLRLLLTLASKSMYTSASECCQFVPVECELNLGRCAPCTRNKSNHIHDYYTPEANRLDHALLSPQYRM